MNILILCTGNSCRSQIAHGYLSSLCGSHVSVYSAGIETHGVNPRAIAVMAEEDIDISQHTSNHIDEYIDTSFNLVLTVCDHANEQCPYFPTSSELIHHNFPDPAKAEGTESEIMDSFRKTRDMIKAYCKDLIEKRKQLTINN